MLTTHKHCYDMKAQTDNAEHINDNRFSILFFGIKSSNNKDNDALEPICCIFLISSTSAPSVNNVVFVFLIVSIVWFSQNSPIVHFHGFRDLL